MGRRRWAVFSSQGPGRSKRSRCKAVGAGPTEAYFLYAARSARANQRRRWAVRSGLLLDGRQLGDNRQQLLESHRLAEDAIHQAGDRRLGGAMLSPPGEENDGDPRQAVPNGRGHVPARHLRHPEVREHEVDRILPEQGDPRRPAVRLGHGMAGNPEQAAERLPHHGVVVHEEEAARRRDRRRRRARLAVRCRPQNLKIQRDGRAAAGRAGHRDTASVAFHDAVCHREPQAGPAPPLGGEEGVEDPPSHLIGHPDPRVRDLQFDPGRLFLGGGPRRRFRVGARRPRRRHRPRGEGQRAALRHRVHGVQDDVGQDLPHFRSVAHDQGDLVQPKLNVDDDAAALEIVLPAGPGDLQALVDDIDQIGRDERRSSPLPRKILQASNHLRTVRCRRLQHPQRILDLGIPTFFDEAYYELENEVASRISLMKKYPNMVVNRTFSKAMGLAGLRLGYCLSDPELASYFNRVRFPWNVSHLAIAAALALLDDPQDQAQKRHNIIEGRDYIYQEINKMPGVRAFPSEGNFVLVDATILGISSLEIKDRIAAQGIFIRPMTGHNMAQGYFRVTVGTPEQNRKFIETFKAFYQETIKK